MSMTLSSAGSGSASTGTSSEDAAGIALTVDGYDTPLPVLDVLDGDVRRREPLTRAPPASPAADLFSDQGLIQLRQRMLEAMDKPRQLEDLYREAARTCRGMPRGRQLISHFQVMKISWADRSQALDTLATSSSFTSTRVFADTYFLWYSSTSIRAAHELQDFSALGNKLRRALTEVSFRQICPMFVAELFQVTVEYIALAILAGHDNAICNILPLQVFTASGQRLEGRAGLVKMVKLLWQWALAIFQQHYCFYDAFMICCELLLITGWDTQCMGAMRAIIENIKADNVDIGNAFDAHLREIGGQLAANAEGRLDPAMVNLALIFGRLGR